MHYAVLLWALLVGVAFADRVHLNDGRVIEGEATWVNGGDQLRVKVKLGAMTFERGEVSRVEETESPADEFARRRQELAATELAKRIELGRFALKHKLKAEAAEVWIEAASFRPSEAQLAEDFEVDAASQALATDLLEHELDYHLHEGRWLPPSEYYPAIGYERYKGQWMPKNVADLRRQRADDEKADRTERAEARKARRDLNKLLREASAKVARQSKRLAQLLKQISEGKREFALLGASLQDLELRAETARDRELVARLALDQWRVSGANDGSNQARQTEQLLVSDLLRTENATRRILAELANVRARHADLGSQLAEAPQAVQREEHALRQAEAALAALEGTTQPPATPSR